jgi:histidine triad (HIT) family protein
MAAKPPAAGCLFCQIASRAVESLIVFEDEHALAFLDHRPLFPGHCLLIPKQHYETLSDLPPELIRPLFSAAQRLARAVETGMQAEGSFVAINNRVSQSVPHLHIHIVPRRKKDGLRGFFWPRSRYASQDEAIAAQAAITKALV